MVEKSFGLRVVLAAPVAALLGAGIQPVRGEDLDWSPVEPAVVMIAGDLYGTRSFGAGLVLGADNEKLYLATADHVVRSGGETATNLRVRFSALPDEEVPAELLTDRDRDLDLAVLAVRLEVARRLAKGIALDILGDPRELRRGDGVFAMGAPEGQRWWVSIDPERFESVAGSKVLFQAKLLRPGHSGGALFDTCRRLVGMLVSDHPPNGEALSIDRLVERVRSWGYPVTLQPSRRAGCEKDRDKLIFAAGVALGMLGQSTEGVGQPVFEVALQQLGVPDFQRKELVERYVHLDRDALSGRITNMSVGISLEPRENLIATTESRLKTLFGAGDARYLRSGYNVSRLLLLLRSWESRQQRGEDVRLEAGGLLELMQEDLDTYRLPPETAAGLRALRGNDLAEPAGRAGALEKLAAAIDVFDLEPF